MARVPVALSRVGLSRTQNSSGSVKTAHQSPTEMNDQASADPTPSRPNQPGLVTISTLTRKSRPPPM